MNIQQNMKFVPPRYPKRAYQALPEELEAYGAATTEEVVAEFNEFLRARKLHPVSVGDYPTTRKRFIRLCQRWQRLLGQE